MVCKEMVRRCTGHTHLLGHWLSWGRLLLAPPCACALPAHHPPLPGSRPACLLRCAAALPAALPSCSIDPVQLCSHALQAVDAEAVALEEQASLLREQVDLLKAQLGRKDSELTQQAQQLAQQAQQLQVARREAAAADERMQQLKQAVAAEAVAAAEVLDKAEQAAQLLGQQLLSMMQSRQEDESDWEEEEEVTLRTAQVRYRAVFICVPRPGVPASVSGRHCPVWPAAWCGQVASEGSHLDCSCFPVLQPLDDYLQ